MSPRFQLMMRLSKICISASLWAWLGTAIAGKEGEQEQAKGVILKALMRDGSKATRLMDGPTAANKLIAMKYLRPKSDLRIDYTSLRILLRPLSMFNHRVLAFYVEEYGDHNVGCCLAEGAGLFLAGTGQSVALDEFADQHGCRVVGESDKEANPVVSFHRLKHSWEKVLEVRCTEFTVPDQNDFK